jgi:pSer/pThr/pTyr-binding forkhead associated (FHA) protein
MSARLIQGNRQWKIGQPVIFMGRSKSAHIQVQDPSASRLHASLRMDENENYHLLDLGSTNGTYVNGRLLLMPELLNTGDVLQICGEIYTFEGNEKAGILTTTRMIKTASKETKAQNMFLLAARYTVNPRLDWSSRPIMQSWTYGQWIKRQEEHLKTYGGEMDKAGPNSHLSFWHFRNEEAAKLAKSVFVCLVRLKESTIELDKELKQQLGMEMEEPLLQFYAAAHRAVTTVRSIGEAGQTRLTTVGDDPSIVQDLCVSAQNSSSGLICSETFKDSLGGAGQTQPFSLTMAGTRKQAVIVYQLGR